MSHLSMTIFFSQNIQGYPMAYPHIKNTIFIAVQMLKQSPLFRVFTSVVKIFSEIIIPADFISHLAQLHA